MVCLGDGVWPGQSIDASGFINERDERHQAILSTVEAEINRKRGTVGAWAAISDLSAHYR